MQLPEAHNLQVPPQPSGWPQELGGQFGAHWHFPNTQTPASQGGTQQVLTHWPLAQRKPGWQLTPAQGFARQAPAG